MTVPDFHHSKRRQNVQPPCFGVQVESFSADI
jgi:hypothetical protein